MVLITQHNRGGANSFPHELAVIAPEDGAGSDTINGFRGGFRVIITRQACNWCRSLACALLLASCRK